MTDSFNWNNKNHKLENSFKEGWQAACNLHVRRGVKNYPKAWLESETFKRLPQKSRRQERAKWKRAAQ